MKRWSIDVMCAYVMVFAVSIMFFGASVCEGADVPVRIAPFKIVLNSQTKGQNQDIQAVISMALSSGCHLGNYEVSLKFDEGDEFFAFAFRYCYIDDNFLASFDRVEIQDYLVENYPVTTVAIATVEGWFEELDADGNVFAIREFVGTDDVEIVNPAKK